MSSQPTQIPAPTHSSFRLSDIIPLLSKLTPSRTSNSPPSRLQRLISSYTPLISEFLTSILLATASGWILYRIMEYYRNKDAVKALGGSDDSGLHRGIARLLKERGLGLTQYERLIAVDAVYEVPRKEQTDDMAPVAFNDLGGMKRVKEAMIRALVFPMRHPHLFANKSSLRQFPKGILLYGPPGTGKTTLARIVAKSCGCAFIHVHKEMLSQKYLGEGEKMTAAVFSLARKLAPAIIFIDEVESVLPNRQRNSWSHRTYEVQMSMILENWDGFRAEQKIMILGATNLVNNLDPAALRRFQYQFKVDLPTEEERLEILKILLRHDDVDEEFDFTGVARLTEGLSGSDLKDILQEAILLPVNEAMLKGASHIEPLTTHHFMTVWERRHGRESANRNGSSTLATTTAPWAAAAQRMQQADPQSTVNFNIFTTPPNANNTSDATKNSQ